MNLSFCFHVKHHLLLLKYSPNTELLFTGILFQLMRSFLQERLARTFYTTAQVHSFYSWV